MKLREDEGKREEMRGLMGLVEKLEEELESLREEERRATEEHEFLREN